jgi:hypothetical protein
MILHDGDHVLIISIYINDLLIAGLIIIQILAAKRALIAVFEIKNLGEARVIVDIYIIRNR